MYLVNFLNWFITDLVQNLTKSILSPSYISPSSASSPLSSLFNVWLSYFMYDQILKTASDCCGVRNLLFLSNTLFLSPRWSLKGHTENPRSITAGGSLHSGTHWLSSSYSPTHPRALISRNRWEGLAKWFGSCHELRGLKQLKNSRIKDHVLKVQLLPEQQQQRQK